MVGDERNKAIAVFSSLVGRYKSRSIKFLLTQHANVELEKRKLPDKKLILQQNFDTNKQESRTALTQTFQQKARFTVHFLPKFNQCNTLLVCYCASKSSLTT
jgi:hypothetical protein